MGSIRKRSDNGLLFFDFRYQEERCREQSLLKDNVANRRNMEKVLARIESEIKLGTFEYTRFFPNSTMITKFAEKQENSCMIADTGIMRAAPIRITKRRLTPRYFPTSGT